MKTFIPKKFIAGFQNRQTKTGRLAFLTYKDEKDNIKFETSWSNWKDDKIPVEEFDNSIMTTLYVGNAAGGCKSGWNYRQEYIQLSDDRGLTFEIPTYEFLELLDYSVCDHGILRGEFVFAWYSNYLHVISREEPRYKEILAHSLKIQQEKITKISQMIPGKEYKLRNVPSTFYNDPNEFYFLGSLPVIKYDLKSSQTKLVFFSKIKPDLFFFTDIKNVDYATSNKLSDNELKENINRFEHTPYSKRWWKEYRFKSKLIPNKYEHNYAYDKNAIYASSIDEYGNIFTQGLTRNNCTEWSYNGYSSGNHVSINFKDSSTISIKWFNLLKDEDINVPIQFVNCPDYWNYRRTMVDIIDEGYVFNSKDRDKIKKNWPEIKSFIESHTINEPISWQGYDLECDGYRFNISEFILHGFLFGTQGNFPVNTIYKFSTK